jgi:predicted membrane protein
MVLTILFNFIFIAFAIIVGIVIYSIFKDGEYFEAFVLSIVFLACLTLPFVTLCHYTATGYIPNMNETLVYSKSSKPKEIKIIEDKVKKKEAIPITKVDSTLYWEGYNQGYEDGEKEAYERALGIK